MEPLRLSLVLPTYNERENLRLLLPRIAGALAGLAYEVVVVDDRSPDGTGEEALAFREAGYPVRLVTPSRREGIGAALRLGYQESRGAIIASMDADLSFDPADLRTLLRELEKGAAFAVGTRHTRASVYAASTLRVRAKRLVSVVGNRVLAALTGIPLTDFTGNFRALRSDVWRALETVETTNTLLFEMILQAYLRGFTVAEVSVSFQDRYHGTSKLRLSREAPKFLRKLASYMWRYRRELRARRSRLLSDVRGG